jgi:hypothetical protein
MEGNEVTWRDILTILGFAAAFGFGLSIGYYWHALRREE